ncbi:RNA polymerase sigma factor [Polyangium mundeleinium]|uniref:Sigma-70 family RNA polymerase sigma factor n=1 Tax=Polyangium mundeleinium TaxID=2995306 RepID=A0ABT5EQX6_9BACT|nr:sigma-70 family RNA polymerase sigma factor [Polyangium mundeleinium]MDC0743111.1 sigma-70 family RNA polymerase sigma factor [Polyangium mundeleinium]
MTSLARVYVRTPSVSRSRLAALAALRPVIFRWTGRWVSSLADRDDITQDVLWEAATCRAGVSVDDADLQPWLFVLTERMALKYGRRARRQASREGASPEDVASNDVSPEDAAERAEFLRAVKDELPKLTARQRAVFIGYEIDEKPHETIAQTLGIPVNSSRNALFEARMRLYAALCARDRGARGVLPLLLLFFSRQWWRGAPGEESSEGSSAPPGRRRSRRWADMLGPLWPPLVGLLVGGAAVAAWLLPSDDASRVRHLHLAPYVLVIFDHVQEPVASIEPPAPTPAPAVDAAPIRPAPRPLATSFTLTPEAERAVDEVLRGRTHDPKDGR